MVQPQCDIDFQVPFHDVDMLHVVWHGHYYKYFELARTALFRKFQFDVARIRGLGYYMVITESHCRYLQPLTYGMHVVARARLTELEFRLKIEYELRERDSSRVLAKGHTVQVTIRGENHELCMVTPEEVAAVFESEAGRCREG